MKSTGTPWMLCVAAVMYLRSWINKRVIYLMSCESKGWFITRFQTTQQSNWIQVMSSSSFARMAVFFKCHEGSIRYLLWQKSYIITFLYVLFYVCLLWLHAPSIFVSTVSIQACFSHGNWISIYSECSLFWLVVFREEAIKFKWSKPRQRSFCMQSKNYMPNQASSNGFGVYTFKSNWKSICPLFVGQLLRKAEMP